MYRIAELTGLGAAHFGALNDKDQLTGADDGQAFFYDSKTGIKQLHHAGVVYSVGFDINESGHVVGYTRSAGPDTSSQHAFLYNGKKLIDLSERLGPLGFDNGSCATSINDAGDIVGTGIRKGASHHIGWLLKGGTEAIDLNAATGHILVPYHINNVGRIIGETGDGSAFWNDAGTTHVHKVQATFNAINDKQQIVGASASGNAIVYEDGTMQNLTGGPAQAWGINNDGLIIGNRHTDGSGNPFIYDLKKPAAGPSDFAALVLGDLAGGVMRLLAINTFGHVIGALGSESWTHLLMKPVPPGEAMVGHNTPNYADLFKKLQSSSKSAGATGGALRPIERVREFHRRPGRGP